MSELNRLVKDQGQIPPQEWDPLLVSLLQIISKDLQGNHVKITEGVKAAVTQITLFLHTFRDTLLYGLESKQILSFKMEIVDDLYYLLRNYSSIKLVTKTVAKCLHGLLRQYHCRIHLDVKQL